MKTSFLILSLFLVSTLHAERRWFIVGYSNINDPDMVNLQSQEGVYAVPLDLPQDIAHARLGLGYYRNRLQYPETYERSIVRCYVKLNDYVKPSLLGMNRDYTTENAPHWFWSVDPFVGFASLVYLIWDGWARGLFIHPIGNPINAYTLEIAFGTVIGEYPYYFTQFDRYTDTKESPWFGRFNDRRWPWLYHNDHGWLYNWGTDIDIGMNPNSIYLYSSGDETVYWTSEGIYPWMYRYKDGAWVYFSSVDPKRRWFYNNTQAVWESLSRPDHVLPPIQDGVP